MKNVKLSLEVARKMYASNDESVKAFALENYSKEELEKPKRPNTVIGMPAQKVFYVSTHSYVGNVDTSDKTCGLDINLWNTEAEAEACLALAQLTRLRDAWNEQPLHEWCDWNTANLKKHSVVLESNRIVVFGSTYVSRPLTFKSEKLAHEFISDPEIRKLIEQAKPLL
jgi:hypothetical protein